MTNMTTDKLVSTLLVEDPEMFEIVDEFVSSLTARITEMENAFRAQDWINLAVLAHRLKGAGGSYGYPDLTTLGAKMETAFKACDESNFSDYMNKLKKLASAAKAGLS